MDIRQKEIYQERAIAYLKIAESCLVNAGYELNGITSTNLAGAYFDLKQALVNFRLKVQELNLKEESK